ncbi:MAG TPA: TolC family protein [Polyangiales bacterium]
MKRWLSSGLVASAVQLTAAAIAGAQSQPPGAPAAPSPSPSVAAASAPELERGSGSLLTLEQALRIAHEHEPSLRQAHATTEVNAARVDQARAPLLPQVVGTLGYTRSTSNYAPQPGLPFRPGAAPPTSFDTYNSFKAGVQANQLIYDFGQTTGKYDSAKATLLGQVETEHAAALLVELNVRAAYFNVAAAAAMLQVASETLANQEHHKAQIQGFVEVGSRPEIDLAQARTNLANARLGVIQADGAHRAAKAQLNQAMGSPDQPDYEVSGETLVTVDGEEKPASVLMDEALRQRPEFRSLVEQRKAQELVLRSVEGGYWPSLNASTGLTEAGAQLGSMAWNWNAGLALNWPLFQGGITKGQAREAHATLLVIDAKLEVLRCQVRLDLEQAWLAVRTAKEAQTAANEALISARLQLGLAEGRYATGVGNALELADAQLALSNARAQQVQSVFNLAVARAQLLKALGRA